MSLFWIMPRSLLTEDKVDASYDILLFQIYLLTLHYLKGQPEMP